MRRDPVCPKAPKPRGKPGELMGPVGPSVVQGGKLVPGVPLTAAMVEAAKAGGGGKPGMAAAMHAKQSGPKGPVAFTSKAEPWKKDEAKQKELQRYSRTLRRYM